MASLTPINGYRNWPSGYLPPTPYPGKIVFKPTHSMLGVGTFDLVISEAIMYWLKGCPRCCGDLHFSNDQYGPFVSCMQCGLNRQVYSEPGEPLLIAAEPSLPLPLPQWQGNKRRRLSRGGRHLDKTLSIGAELPAQLLAFFSWT